MKYKVNDVVWVSFTWKVSKISYVGPARIINVNNNLTYQYKVELPINIINGKEIMDKQTSVKEQEIKYLIER